MRVSRAQVAEHRQRIIEVASRRFRETGVGDTGIAALMEEAGLTHGGFYGHFDSKEALAVAAMEEAAERAVATWESRVARAPDAPVQALLDGYLTTAHRDHPATGCAFVALAADAARHKHRPFRRAFTHGLRRCVDVLQRALPGRNGRAARQQALAMFSGMVGAILLSRAVNDAELSAEILSATRAWLARASAT